VASPAPPPSDRPLTPTPLPPAPPQKPPLAQSLADSSLLGSLFRTLLFKKSTFLCKFDMAAVR
jgi:hypothetical protein